MIDRLLFNEAVGLFCFEQGGDFVKVRINIRSDSLHTSGVITGFYMLDKQGIFNIEFNDLRKDKEILGAIIEAEM